MNNYCCKREKRNLFCLFKTYLCLGCLNNKEDENIVIGRQILKIYPITSCKLIDDDNIYLFNQRLKKLLLSFTIYQNEAILLWLDKCDRMEDYAFIFEAFMDLNLDIFIIIF